MNGSQGPRGIRAPDGAAQAGQAPGRHQLGRHRRGQGGQEHAPGPQRLERAQPGREADAVQRALHGRGPHPDPSNSSPVGVSSISLGSSHVQRTPMAVYRTCGEPNEISYEKNTHPGRFTAPLREQARRLRRTMDAFGTTGAGMRREPFNSTPMGVNSISSGSPHVRPMGVHRTCGEPDEIKKHTHTRNTLPLLSACRSSAS